MKVCCVFVNILLVVGGIGDMYNELILFLILGCGLYGRNLILYNVSVIDLLNIKMIVKWCNNI